MYVWNSRALLDAAVMPKKAKNALKVATFTQLKVLVWMATCGQSEISAAACAEALGGRVSEADCADALAFWQAEGVLTATDEPAGKQAGAPRATDTPSSKDISKATTSTDEKAKKEQKSPAAEKTATSGQNEPPAAKTASGNARVLTAADAARAKKTAAPKASRKEFLELLRSVESRFGKTLSRADQERLLDLCEVTALPMEVLLMIVAYTVKNDKKRVSYIQTVARNWEEQGINTIDAADRYLCHIEQREKAWSKLVSWISPEVTKPTVLQKDLACKWIFDLKQKQPLVTLAYEKTLAKTGKFQATYMDRMLTAWHEDGITTPDKVNAPASPASKKPVKKGEGGFDVEKYEKLVAERTPRFRKKG